MRLGSWILFTTLGWIAGIPLLMIVSGGLEPIGLEKTAVALGMSTGISVFQWLHLRRFLSQSTRWIWLSPLAFVAPFLIADLIGNHWFASTESAIVICTLTGSALLAIGHYHFILKAAGIKPIAWIAVNLVAYALAIVPPFTLTVVRINELHLPGVLSVVLSFLTVLAGGPIIGWLTGIVLVRKFATPQGV